MASINQLLIKITGESSSFERAIAAAQRSAAQLADRLNSVGNILSTSLTLPIGLAGAAALKSASDFESLERGLAAVTKEAGPLTTQLDRLQKVAQLPGLGFREAVQGSINLQAAGFSAKTAERALSAFGNALATVGKGRAELDGVVLALTQIQSKGKVSAEEINQLAERLPQIRVAIQNAFGTADTELIGKAGISSQEFVERIIREFERLPQVTGGVANSFENFRDKSEQALAQVGKALIPFATAALDALTPLVSKLGEVGSAFGRLDPTIQTATISLLGLAVAVGPILKLAAALKELEVVTLFAAGATKATVAFEALSGAIRAVPAALAGFTESASVGLFLTQATVIAGGATAIFLAFQKLGLLKNVGLDTSAKAIDELNQKFKASTVAANDSFKGLSGFSDAIFNVGKASAGALDPLDDRLQIVAEHTGKLIDLTKAIPWQEKSKEAQIFTAEIGLLGKAQRELLNDIVKLRELSNFDVGGLSLFDLISAGQPDVQGLNTGLRSLSEELRRIDDQNAKAAISFLKVGAAVDALNQKARSTELFSISSEEIDRIADQQSAIDLKVQFPPFTEAEKEAQRFNAALRSIRDNSIRDVADGLTDVITRAKSFGDAMRGVALNISQNLIRFAIENGIKLVIGELGKLTGVLGQVGRLFASVFGGVASSAGSISTGIQTATQAGQQAANAGSGAASAALGGVTGIVGAISSVATAVFSGLQFFQGRRMEQDIGRIEVTSRQIFAEVSNRRQDAWTQHNQTFARLGELLSAVQGGGFATASAGGPAVVIQQMIVQGGTTQQQALAVGRELDRVFRLQHGTL